MDSLDKKLAKIIRLTYTLGNVVDFIEVYMTMFQFGATLKVAIYNTVLRKFLWH